MATDQQVQLQQALNDLIKDQRDLIKEINRELQSGINVTKEVRKQYSALEDISDKLVDDADDIVELTEKQLEKEKDRARTAIAQLKASYSILQTQIKQGRALDTLTDQEKALLEAGRENVAEKKKAFAIEDETLKLIEKRIDKQKSLNKAVGLTGALLKGSASFAEKIGFSGTIVEESLKKAKKAAYDKAKALEIAGKNMDGLGVKVQTMAVGLKSLGGSLLKSLKDPLVLLTIQVGLIKKFYDLYGGLNQRIVNQGRQLGISEKQSEAIYNRSLQYAASQRDAFVTGARITEGREKLNQALGTSIDFTDREAITAEKLSHYYGITEEQNAHLAMYAREIGQTNTDLLHTILRTANEQKRQIGGSLSYQKIVQKVSSVSGEILTKFKGNVTELTKAVQQADKLGLTLEQVDKIGESLLNFEQSIEAELKAELLTGKAINLEKARAAALSGNQVKLMNEITTQVGNIHKFERMNVIQRQAYAEAFGMSVSEMGDMLRKKELEAKLGVDISKSATEALRLANEKGITVDESIRKELENKSLAELQKYTFEKIKTILEKIAAGPMRTIYNLLEKGFKFAESIFGFFGKMTGGVLGDALGTVLLAAPAIVLAIRGLIGFGRGLLMGPRGTDLNPMVVRMQGVLGTGVGMGGGNRFVPGVGMVSGATNPALYSQFRAQGMNPAAAKQAALAQQQQMAGAASMRNMGIGMGLGLGGMALNAAASGMTPGGARTTVGTLGGAATGAGMGMMFGPWGAAIGGVIGGVYGLITELKASREQEEANRQREKAERERVDKLIQSVSDISQRPLVFNAGTDTIANLQTAQRQYGAPSVAG